MLHPLRGRKQSPEHIAKRVAAFTPKLKGRSVWNKGIRTGVEPPNKVRFTPEMDSAIRRMYVDERKSVKGMAMSLGCKSRTAIFRRMNELGIVRRTSGESRVGTKQSAETIEKRVSRLRNNPSPKVLAVLQDPARRQRMSEKAMERMVDGKSYYRQGRYASTKTGREFWYRSSYELRYMQILDADESVAGWEYEPAAITIEYEHEGQIRRYKPDFLVEYADGRRLIVEVKSKHSMREYKNVSKMSALQGFCCSLKDTKAEIFVADGRTMEHSYTLVLN